MPLRGPGSRRRWLTANRLQVTVTVAIALLLAAATWSSGRASGQWQQATREAARSSIARVESVRFVYQSELPLALGLAQARVRRDAVGDLDPEGRPEMLAEVSTTKQLVAQLEMNAEQAGNGLAHGDDYATPEGGYDVPRRLGDVLAKDDVARLDTAPATMRAGDRWAQRARGWALLALGSAAAYAVLAALRGHRRRRRGEDAPDVGLIPAPWGEPRRRRAVAVLALVAWLALPLLTAEQLALSASSARSAARSALLISEISGSTAVSQVRSAAEADVQMRGVDVMMGGLTRQYTATLSGSRGQELLGLAEEQAGNRWITINAAMTAVPSAGDGVDTVTRRWLASGPAAWKRLGSGQEHAQAAADRSGSAGDAVTLGLLLAGLAATAATVARLPGSLRRSATLLATGLLGLALAIAAAAWV